MLTMMLLELLREDGATHGDDSEDDVDDNCDMVVILR